MTPSPPLADWTVLKSQKVWLNARVRSHQRWFLHLSGGPESIRCSRDVNTRGCTVPKGPFEAPCTFPSVPHAVVSYDTPRCDRSRREDNPYGRLSLAKMQVLTTSQGCPRCRQTSSTSPSPPAVPTCVGNSLILLPKLCSDRPPRPSTGDPDRHEVFPEAGHVSYKKLLQHLCGLHLCFHPSPDPDTQITHTRTDPPPPV